MHQTVASVLSEKAMTHLRLSKSAPALHIRNSVPQPVLNSLAQPSHSTAQSLSVAGPYLKWLTRGSACFNMFFVSSQGSFLPVGSHPWQVYDECQCCLVRTCCARSANMLMDDVWFFRFELASPGVDVRRCRRLNTAPLKARKGLVFLRNVGKTPASLASCVPCKLLAWASATPKHSKRDSWGYLRLPALLESTLDSRRRAWANPTLCHLRGKLQLET